MIPAPYVFHGHRRTGVLLLHGLAGNPLELLPVARALSDDGYSVSVPLIEGYGRDRRRGSPRPFEAWIEQARAHLRDLSGRASVVVGGLCIGAVLALELAATEDVAGALLLSPTLFFDGWNVSRWAPLLPLAFLPGIRRHLRFEEKPPFGLKNERMRQWIRQQMHGAGISAAGALDIAAEELYQARRLIRRARTRLPEVRQPVSILHAVEDDVASPRSAAFLASRLGAAHIELNWFRDSYHMLTLDNERAQVVDRCRRFIRQLDDDTADARPEPLDDDLAAAGRTRSA